MDYTLIYSPACFYHFLTMPCHNRYSVSGRFKRLIAFERLDLLIDLNQPVVNPHTKESCSIPFPYRDKLIGPNIHDCIIRKIDDEGRTIWTLRSPTDFFENPVKIPDDVPHPFRKKLCTGGTETYTTAYSGFRQIVKRSTVSINAKIFALAVGMQEGKTQTASALVEDIATQKWEEDLQRAYKLYGLIKEAVAKDGFLLESELQDKFPAFKAQSTISQAVEDAVLAKACIWLGIPPDFAFPKPRGRREQPTEEYVEGKYIRLVLKDGETSGLLIGTLGKFKAGLELEILPLVLLVELLGLIEEAGADYDADLLEAYLDALDEDWRDRVLDDFDQRESQENPYKILGLESSASSAEVRSAYINLQQQFHPDKGNIPSWISAKLNWAYEQLVE